MALYTVMKGPVDYTVVGSPTITDGMASGFSANDYIVSSSALPSSFLSLSGSVKFKTGSSFSNENMSTLVFFHLRIGWSSAGKPAIRYYNNGSEQTSYFSNTLANNKEYVLNFKITSSTIDMSVYDGDVLIESNTYSGSYELPFERTANFGKAGSASYLSYSYIDLNNTYIKVNDQVWFGHGPQRVKIRMAPYTRYTVVGSPTITDGVASGFSSNDYLQLSNKIYFGNNFEILTKINTGTLSGSSIIFSGKTGQYINFGYYSSTHVIQYNIGNGTSWLVTSSQTRGTTAISSDTTYYIKLTFDGEVYKSFISTDGNNWSLDWSFSSTNVIPQCDILFGVNRAITQPFQGTIDLNNSYIIADGQYVWRGDMQNVETYTLHQGE